MQIGTDEKREGIPFAHLRKPVSSADSVSVESGEKTFEKMFARRRGDAENRIL
jgi:hypothetical protein